MAIDRDKVLAAAQKFVDKKKYDKAVVELQKIIAEDPNDARTLLKIGDYQSKMEAYGDAIATYERVGRQYASQGFALKAIAVYKQIRELITKHVPQLETQYAHITPKLAELYQQLGLISDALAALDEVATRLQRQQREQEAINVFKKIVELDPTNPLPHLRLAEALSRSQSTDEAVHEFATAASQLLKLGRRDDALKVFERLLHHKPDPIQARICAELYLARGQQADGMQALAKLQLCFQANPRDFDTLNLLARAFNVIGQAAKAIEVQKEMARIARDTGKDDVLRPLLQQLLKTAPNDEGVRKLATQAGLIADVGGPPPPPSAPMVGAPPAAPSGRSLGGPPAPPRPPVPPPAPSAPTGVMGARPQPPLAPRPYGAAGRPPIPREEPSYPSYESVDEDELVQDASNVDEDAQQYLESVPPDDDVIPASPSPAARPAYSANYVTSGDREDDGQLEVVETEEPVETPDVSEHLAQILADAASFRRVRLYPKAIATLRQGIQLEPRSFEVHEALRDVLLESGRTTEAVDEMLTMASLFIDALDGEGAARMLQDVLTVDPSNARAVDMLRELGYEYVDDAGSAQYPDADQVSAQRPPGGSYAGEAPLPSYDLEEMGPEDISNEYSDPRVIMSPQMQDARARIAIDNRPVVSGREPPLPSFPLEAPEAEPSEPFDLVQSADTFGGDTAQEQEAYRPRGEDTSRSSRGAELEEALEEADFFASRGLYDDARNVLLDQIQLHPNNRLLKEKVTELEQQEQSAKRGSGTRERPIVDAGLGVDRSFDIAASLDAIEEPSAVSQGGFDHADKQVDVEEVFSKFKDGVAKQISIDDGQSHYDLGLAYKEMGLIDDAIREFETAARDPKRECICRSMIGMIQIERGHVNEAIDAFMRGLHAQIKTSEQDTMLSFEIGSAYEIKKMNREALSYYQKVIRKEPNYRDVQDRVRRLSAPSKPPRQVAVGADDEFDRAFDDLIAGTKS